MHESSSLVQRIITEVIANVCPKKNAHHICVGEYVYVEFEHDEWHLGRIIAEHTDVELGVLFHDDEVARVNFATDRHCMATDPLLRLSVCPYVTMCGV